MKRRRFQLDRRGLVGVIMGRLVGTKGARLRAMPLAVALFASAGALAAIGLARTADGAANERDRPPHVYWAERLVSELTTANNVYAWNPTYVVWNEDHNGVARNRSVCSSFITRDLERAYGIDRADVRSRFGTTNPQAKDYYATIVAERGFARIARVTDARPGDIVAIRYPTGSHPTGHALILDGVAHLRPSTKPVIAGSTQYEVAVIDSSRSFHGLQDTRFHGEGLSGGGVGRGVFRLYADADGRIAGYSWSTRPVSKYFGASDREIAIGRFAPTYAGAPVSPVSSRSSDDAEESIDSSY